MPIIFPKKWQIQINIKKIAICQVMIAGIIQFIQKRCQNYDKKKIKKHVKSCEQDAKK